ncbi:hypothetical protein Ciccas_002959 [Cichlidogyrus casuarinus]|uniref:Uncharacterized protein n=1 Tax=Cichlidogyrus casuarinus TaxID=1844966 RepID=A0ABD2QFR3_9PLAT
MPRGHGLELRSQAFICALLSLKLIKPRALSKMQNQEQDSDKSKYSNEFEKLDVSSDEIKSIETSKPSESDNEAVDKIRRSSSKEFASNLIDSLLKDPFNLTGIPNPKSTNISSNESFQMISPYDSDEKELVSGLVEESLTASFYRINNSKGSDSSQAEPKRELCRNKSDKEKESDSETTQISSDTGEEKPIPKFSKDAEDPKATFKRESTNNEKCTVTEKPVEYSNERKTASEKEDCEFSISNKDDTISNQSSEVEKSDLEDDSIRKSKETNQNASAKEGDQNSHSQSTSDKIMSSEEEKSATSPPVKNLDASQSKHSKEIGSSRSCEAAKLDLRKSEEENQNSSADEGTQIMANRSRRSFEMQIRDADEKNAACSPVKNLDASSEEDSKESLPQSNHSEEIRSIHSSELEKSGLEETNQNSSADEGFRIMAVRSSLCSKVQPCEADKKIIAHSPVKNLDASCDEGSEKPPSQSNNSDNIRSDLEDEYIRKSEETNKNSSADEGAQIMAVRSSVPLEGEHREAVSKSIADSLEGSFDKKYRPQLNHLKGIRSILVGSSEASSNEDIGKRQIDVASSQARNLDKVRETYQSQSGGATSDDLDQKGMDQQELVSLYAKINLYEKENAFGSKSDRNENEEEKREIWSKASFNDSVSCAKAKMRMEDKLEDVKISQLCKLSTVAPYNYLDDEGEAENESDMLEEMEEEEGKRTSLSSGGKPKNFMQTDSESEGVEDLEIIPTSRMNSLKITPRQASPPSFSDSEMENIVLPGKMSSDSEVDGRMGRKSKITFKVNALKYEKTDDVEDEIDPAWCCCYKTGARQDSEEEAVNYMRSSIVFK